MPHDLLDVHRFFPSCTESPDQESRLWISCAWHRLIIKHEHWSLSLAYQLPLSSNVIVIILASHCHPSVAILLLVFLLRVLCINHCCQLLSSTRWHVRKGKSLEQPHIGSLGPTMGLNIAAPSNARSEIYHNNCWLWTHSSCTLRFTFGMVAGEDADQDCWFVDQHWTPILVGHWSLLGLGLVTFGWFISIAVSYGRLLDISILIIMSNWWLLVPSIPSCSCLFFDNDHLWSSMTTGINNPYSHQWPTITTGQWFFDHQYHW